MGPWSEHPSSFGFDVRNVLAARRAATQPGEQRSKDSARHEAVHILLPRAARGKSDDDVNGTGGDVDNKATRLLNEQQYKP